MRPLAARDEIAALAGRGENVCLHVDKEVRWRPLLEHLQEATLPGPLLPDLGIVHLDDERTASRSGLLEQILRAVGHQVRLPDRPHDVAAFGDLLDATEGFRLSLTHFDLMTAPERRTEYDSDLFAALRRGIGGPEKKVGLLAVSHAPVHALRTAGHPLTDLELKSVRLEATC